MKVTPDPRVRLLPSPTGPSTLTAIPGLSGGGYSLELKDVRPQDAGDYVCQIGTMEPREITHTLEILGTIIYLLKVKITFMCIIERLIIRFELG